MIHFSTAFTVFTTIKKVVELLLKLEFISNLHTIQFIYDNLYTIVILQLFNILPYLTTIQHFGAKTRISCILSCRSSINNIPDGLFWLCFMNFSCNVWIYEVMNLSISRSFCEFQLIRFYFSLDITDKRHKTHVAWDRAGQRTYTHTSNNLFNNRTKLQ